MSLLKDDKAGKAAVVVDPYSTGVLIAPALARRGYRCVAVQTSPTLSPSLLRAYRPDDFIDHILLGDDREAGLRRIRAHAPAFVLPGNESAVEAADWLGEALGTRGNGTRLTVARRNKYRMIGRLAEAGLHTARQTVVEDIDAACAWAAEAGWPVVAKPLDSASTDHVSVCESADELAVAVDSILSSVNFCGRPNRQALIQTYLDGPEYVVNTVSRDGRHYVTDVLESRKRTLNGSRLIYDFYRLISPQDPAAVQLMDYVRRTLDVLEIGNGAAHAELRMTASGPALVEIAARAMGPLGSTQAIARGTGHDQVDLLVDAFDDAAVTGPLFGGHYRMQRHAMVVYVPVLGCGRVLAHADAGWVGALPSVRGYQTVPAPGQMVRPTLDLTEVLAKAYLAHDDEATLLADYRAIRAGEARLQPRLAQAATGAVAAAG